MGPFWAPELSILRPTVIGDATGLAYELKPLGFKARILAADVATAFAELAAERLSSLCDARYAARYAGVDEPPALEDALRTARETWWRVRDFWTAFALGLDLWARDGGTYVARAL